VKIDLSGRVGIVTGGSRGIGYSIAQALAGAGAKVAVLGRDGAKAEQAARALGTRRRAAFPATSRMRNKSSAPWGRWSRSSAGSTSS